MSDNRDLQMLTLQNEILGAIASGMEFEELAHLLCTRVEALVPCVLCSILSIDDQRRLRPVAAPSIPPIFSEAIDGLEIAADAGSCGTAAFLGRPVEVMDIASDPLWARYRDLALPLGLRACWSSPIVAPDGRALATFAFYYRDVRSADAFERRIVEACVHLCALALEQAEIRRRNEELAHYDQLTGLPNRRRFDEYMTLKCADRVTPFGLLLIDSDNLKITNDTLGHAVGDRLLKEVATRLRSMEVDFVCRLSGDEFAAIVDPCPDHAALERAADLALGAMLPPFRSGATQVNPRVTIGGALFDIDGSTSEMLRQSADFALYHGKDTNRGRYVRFAPNLRTSITRRMESIRQLDLALKEDRVVAHYQPLISMGTSEIVGVEALARIVDLDGTLIPAVSFQDALSDQYLAYRLTDCMLRNISRDMHGWMNSGVECNHVGLNLSAGDVTGDLETRLNCAFGSMGVPLNRLVLEITESVFMSDLGENTISSIERLREQGVAVALDDFGTGFASLTHLLTFPVDSIKIDKSFIKRLLNDRPSAVIVEALIDIAQKLDAWVVAEGIETAAQHERLRDMGCTIGQGYYFARPSDARTTAVMLKQFGIRDRLRFSGSDATQPEQGIARRA